MTAVRPAPTRSPARPAYAPARAPLPPIPDGEIALQPPPLLPKSTGAAATQLMFMLPMMLGMGAMSFTYIARAGGPMVYIFGALFAGAMGGMVVMSLTRGGAAKKAQINNDRRDYQRYLAGLRTRVHAVGRAQQAALEARQPAPDALWRIVDSPRLWERTRDDADFTRVRVGTGPHRLATPLRAPQTAPLEDLDPVSSKALRQFIRTHSTVPDLPVPITVRGFASIELTGSRAQRLDLVRAVIAQLSCFHSPADVRLCLCVAPDRAADWEWVKWLPHLQDSKNNDVVGPARLVADNVDSLADALAKELGDRPLFGQPLHNDELPHIVVLVDGGRTFGDGRLVYEHGRAGVTVIDVSNDVPAAEPSPISLGLHLAPERLGRVTADGIALVAEPDGLDAASAEVLARHLAPRYSRAPARRASPMSSTFGLAGLLGIGDPRDTDPDRTWAPRPAQQRLRIPIGIDLDGLPVELDLKESAEAGMGPHGLVIGATGSGKSELLRTLVTGLAVTHSSEKLNLALIDFKGGATFAGMSELPHVSAVITNLSDDLALVDRMADAVRGELVRRQELLRAAGNYASVRDYELARDGGAELEPMPSLLVIIDEFSELLSARPEFIDLFVMIGRLGRSLAVHLLLASQRLEEGKLRGLDSHLSYRIALRTFSASESRAVLSVPDAYSLPPIPGSAFLKIDTDNLIRLKAAYVSGGLPPRGATDNTVAADKRVLPFTLAPTELVAIEEEPDENSAPALPEPGVHGETIMTAMLGPLEGRGVPAHQIWLPPLDEPPTLAQLLPPLDVDPQRGLCPVGWGGNGRLVVPLATVDKPFEQRRDVFWADLSAAGGHLAVVGAPQSGKSTVLRTMVSSLALTHTPAEAQFFLLDMGGGLASIAGLPHVSGHATRLDPETCRRIVAEVNTILTRREQQFPANNIDGAGDFRRRRSSLTGVDEPGREFGDVFLIVDDWQTVRQEYEKLEEQITTIAARGLGFGVHVAISAGRWMGMRPQLRDMLGTRVELRLGDPADSALDRRAAQNVPADRPGRGLTPDKLHFLAALPRIDGDQSAETVQAGTTDMVTRVREAWAATGAQPAPRVRLLPREVPLSSFPAPPPGRKVLLGLSEADLGPVYLDFETDPHFLAFADVEAGKTALLRRIAHGIVEKYTAAESAIIVVDYRRGLLDVVQGDHLLGYAGAEPVVNSLIPEVVQAMEMRLPGPDITAEQLRSRSWWEGPELFVIVDDYELVATGGRNPLAPLVEFLPQARDIGLHVIVARGVGGASRALFEPVIQRLRDLGSPGMIMSGSKDEGVLLGDVKPSPQPPGRGTLVSRRLGSQLVQIAWEPPQD